MVVAVVDNGVVVVLGSGGVGSAVVVDSNLDALVGLVSERERERVNLDVARYSVTPRRCPSGRLSAKLGVSLCRPSPSSGWHPAEHQELHRPSVRPSTCLPHRRVDDEARDRPSERETTKPLWNNDRTKRAESELCIRDRLRRRFAKPQLSDANEIIRRRGQRPPIRSRFVLGTCTYKRSGSSQGKIFVPNQASSHFRDE